MRTYIKVTNEMRAELVKSFGVTRKHVYESLNYKKNSPCAQRIRRKAFDLGGERVSEVYTPDCKTEFLSGGRMMQTFANDVKVLFTGSDAVIFVAGKVEKEIKNVRLSTWTQVLKVAEGLSRREERDN